MAGPKDADSKRWKQCVDAITPAFAKQKDADAWLTALYAAAEADEVRGHSDARARLRGVLEPICPDVTLPAAFRAHVRGG